MINLPLLPTDEIASPLLKGFVTPIAAGAPARLFNALDQDARPLDLNDDCLAGWPLLIAFVQSLDHPIAETALIGLAGSAAVAGGSLKVVVVTAETNAKLNRLARSRLNLPFPVITDSSGSFSVAYGLHKNGRKLSPTPVRLVALTPLRRIRAFLDIDDMNYAASFADAFIADAAAADIAAWAPPHAPVLIVPQVLTDDECARLIREFDATGALQAARPRAGGTPTDYKIPSYEHGRQDRIDHLLANPELVQFLDARLQERVIPLVHQAFSFTVTRREDFHIARYAGERSGHEIGHRDNRTATQYRRFALSLNLNNNYEGGGVVFREFTNRAYKNPAGSALVFSSSLLHEVQETSSGVRYTLISHFFDDASLQQQARRP